MKKAMTQIWQWMGATNRTRRRNAFILIILFLLTAIAICYSGVIHVTVTRMMQ